MLNQITMDGETFRVQIRKGGLCVTGLNKSKTAFPASPLPWEEDFIVDLASNLADSILMEVQLDRLGKEREKLVLQYKSS